MLRSLDVLPLVALFTTLSACAPGSGSDDAGARDAAAAIDAPRDAFVVPIDANADGEIPDAWRPVEDGRLVMGEGELVLTPIDDGRMLSIARGCQGSQHVWISLRATSDLDPRGITVDLQLVRTRDELVVSSPFLVRLSFTTDTSGTYSELDGLTLILPDPSLALGEDLRLEGTITDRNGVSASSVRWVRVEWGTEVCGGG